MDKSSTISNLQPQGKLDCFEWNNILISAGQQASGGKNHERVLPWNDSTDENFSLNNSLTASCPYTGIYCFHSIPFIINYREGS